MFLVARQAPANLRTMHRGLGRPGNRIDHYSLPHMLVGGFVLIAAFIRGLGYAAVAAPTKQQYTAVCNRLDGRARGGRVWHIHDSVLMSSLSEWGQARPLAHCGACRTAPPSNKDLPSGKSQSGRDHVSAFDRAVKGCLQPPVPYASCLAH